MAHGDEPQRVTGFDDVLGGMRVWFACLSRRMPYGWDWVCGCRLEGRLADRWRGRGRLPRIRVSQGGFGHDAKCHDCADSHDEPDCISICRFRFRSGGRGVGGDEVALKDKVKIAAWRSIRHGSQSPSCRCTVYWRGLLDGDFHCRRRFLSGLHGGFVQ